MTTDQLLALVARDALRPRMQFVELAGDHVSLDEITGEPRTRASSCASSRATTPSA